MKKIIAITLLLAFTVTNGCSLFKRREVTKKLDKIEQKSETAVSALVVDTTRLEQKGVSVKNTKNFTEEITYKTAPEYLAASRDIELTANFKIDTSAIVGDTVVKLVDVDDSRVSVSIYQNKKTNELMAKITSAVSTKKVPFSEIKITRNYSETSDSTDTSKIVQNGLTKSLDSTAKTSTSSQKLDKKVVSSVNWTTLILGVLFAGAIGYLVYRGYKKYKTIKNL